ncbi:hypothetical protein TgHK011_000613 [Trichoderma gracile]|nr:hypothetical protein TgHK011_000613 [Trichoderma gracile]
MASPASIERSGCNERTALPFSPRADRRLACPTSTLDSFLLATMASSSSPYPLAIPLESGKNRPIRGLYPSVPNAVHNPQVASLSRNVERSPVPEQSVPSTEATGVPSGLSRQSLQALAVLSPDFASQEQSTARATGDPSSSDGNSDSSSGSSRFPNDDKTSKWTDGHIPAEHAVSHMAAWAKDSLNDLNKK